jgi:nitroreductase
MDLSELLQKRYSCRAYLDKDVSDRDIAKMLNYASLAPSAGNLQPWQVIVIKNKEKRNSLAIASLNQTWMKQAPVHLVICGNEEYVKKFYKSKGEVYSIQSCAAFIENLLLFATDLGLATCWVGAFDDNMLKRELNIPKEIKVYAIITLGYCNEKNPNSKKRYDLHTFTRLQFVPSRKEHSKGKRKK